MKGYEFRVALCVLVLTFVSIGANAQKGRASVSAAEVTGTFQMNFTGRFRKSTNDIKIASIGRGKIRVAMDLIYPYRLPNGDDMANTGQLDETFTIKGDTATYESQKFSPCVITIRFVRAGTIKVTQNGLDSDCGFGHNVSADGTYRKTSSRKPKFETEN